MSALKASGSPTRSPLLSLLKYLNTNNNVLYDTSWNLTSLITVAHPRSSILLLRHLYRIFHNKTINDGIRNSVKMNKCRKDKSLNDP